MAATSRRLHLNPAAQEETTPLGRRQHLFQASQGPPQQDFPLKRGACSTRLVSVDARDLTAFSFLRRHGLRVLHERIQPSLNAIRTAVASRPRQTRGKATRA